LTAKELFIQKIGTELKKMLSQKTNRQTSTIEYSIKDFAYERIFMIKLRKIIVSLVLVWTFVCNSLPLQAQDFISTSDDISNGSSVFVLRQSRNASQSKVAFVRTRTKRTVVERKETRKKVRQQVVIIKKAKPKPVKAKPVKKTPPPPNVEPPKKNEKPNVEQLDTSEAFTTGADTYIERKQIEKAIPLYRKAIEFNPKNKDAQLGLSDALTMQADDILDKALAPQDETTGVEYTPQSAAALYLEAIELNENNAEAYAGLGEVYDSTEDSEGSNENKDKAISAYNKALSISADLTELFAPLGILFFQKGEIAKAETYLAKAVTTNVNDWETQFFLGLVRYKQNANTEALAALKKSVQLNPKVADVQYYLGEVYDRLDKDTEAIAAYNEAIKINPNYIEAWFDLGVANYNRGRYDKAIAAYTQVKKLKNDYTDAWLNLADVYRKLGDSNRQSADLAKENYTKANGEYVVGATLASRSKEYSKEQKSDIYSKFGYCLGKTQNWDSAITQLKKAVDLDEDEIDYTNLGWAYYNAAGKALTEKDQDKTKKLLKQAKDALKKATKLNPKSIGGFLNLGLTNQGLGEFDDAIEALKQVNLLKENWDIARYELGFSYSLKKDFTNASEQFKLATDINKDFVDAYYQWGISENALGRKDSANVILKKLRTFKTTKANNLATSLELTIKGAVLNEGKRQVENKINENNPLNKIPKIPKLPF
jgi:tetratricopeptide (TPR) repeat protein